MQILLSRDTTTHKLQALVYDMPESDARSVCTLHCICCSISMLSWSAGQFSSELKPAGPDRTPKPAGGQKRVTIRLSALCLGIAGCFCCRSPRQSEQLSRGERVCHALLNPVTPLSPHPTLPHPIRLSFVVHTTVSGFKFSNEL